MVLFEHRFDVAPHGSGATSEGNLAVFFGGIVNVVEMRGDIEHDGVGQRATRQAGTSGSWGEGQRREASGVCADTLYRRGDIFGITWLQYDLRFDTEDTFVGAVSSEVGFFGGEATTEAGVSEFGFYPKVRQWFASDWYLRRVRR